MSQSPLMQPFTLGHLKLKNRVVMAPLTRARAGKDRVPTEMMAEYYAQRASAGLIISEATVISEQAIGWINTPGIYNDAQVAGWTTVTNAVHEAGGKIYLQLWHMGRSSHSSFHHGQPPVSASAIKISESAGQAHTYEGKQPYETPRALATEEIPGIVADYRAAAERAQAAGFDGVEIHAANGYLIDQFLQSKTNHRTDLYGGSVENRYRFLGEVVAAVTEVFEPSRVGVRLAPNGVYNDMGSPDFREQFTYAAQQLSPLGLAYLHVVDGLAFGFHEKGKPMTLAEFRQVFSGPLMGNCGYDQEMAAAAITSGDADLIAFGRPFISNPDLAERFAHQWPLAPIADTQLWYGTGPNAHGYTDFPTFAEASAAR
ncbi:alkene reductase [Blastopirellula marina]|uniref:Xenobiotic reductase B n=1 Tax=Blastopirellula marina DSM 3645 TaxID=314230 RepID=A4A0A4_9BACT|nr:alkene reductase [Blastopirellula marina]EAQ77724.1 xenobiotic reductase B [Blastopirellula marina DSM 3645]